MSVFLILDETDHAGNYLRKITVNADAIIRIDSVEPNLCSFQIQPCQLAAFYVAGTLGDVLLSLQDR